MGLKDSILWWIYGALSDFFAFLCMVSAVSIIGLPLFFVFTIPGVFFMELQDDIIRKTLNKRGR